MKYSTWSNWFSTSIIIFIMIIFIMTLPGSINIKSLPYLLIVAIINLIIATYYGTKSD